MENYDNLTAEQLASLVKNETQEKKNTALRVGIALEKIISKIAGINLIPGPKGGKGDKGDKGDKGNIVTGKQIGRAHV